MAARQAQAVPAEGPALSALGRLGRSFFARPSPVVARDLLGRLLVKRLDDPPDGLLVARLVECEAYQEDDPASHSYRGITGRTAVMFGQPGHLYVYLSYGMHHCMNVVTGREGEGSAVLLRAAEPLEGLEAMAAARGLHVPGLLCAGPGRLTQAFGVARADNGLDLSAGGAVFVSRGCPLPDEAVQVSPRIGISVAVDRPWRFFQAGSPFVSRPTPRGVKPSARASASVSRMARTRVKGRVTATAPATASGKRSGSVRGSEAAGSVGPGPG